MAVLKCAFVIACLTLFTCVLSDDCLRVQSEWCKDLKHAIKCSAVNHCMTTSWKNEIPLEDSSEECLFCQSIVREVINFIADNKSLEFIEDFFMKACDLIPSTTVSAENPEVICGLIGFCKNQFNHLKSNDEHYFETVGSNEKEDIDICKECKDFFNEVRDNLFSKEVEEVIKFIDDFVCQLIIIGKEKCKEITAKYVPQFFAELRKNFDPDRLCAVFCNSGKFLADNSLYKKKVASLLATLKSPGSFCRECKGLLAVIKEEFSDPKVMNLAVNFAVTNICSFIRENELDMCVISSKEVAKNILEFVLTKMDPDVVCCGNITSPKKAFESKVVDLKDDKCQVCEMVAQYLEALLETDVVVSKIENLVSKICTFLPEVMQPSCHNMIEEYGPIIVHYVAVYASPREVCQFLNLCGGDLREHHKCIQGPVFWCASPKNAKLCMVRVLLVFNDIMVMLKNTVKITVESKSRIREHIK